MSNWHIQLKKVGRKKVTKGFEFKARTLPEAELQALRCCKKYLESDHVYLETYDGINYTVEAGSRTVGVVVITSLEKRKVSS